jgi:hypothetical protein
MMIPKGEGCHSCAHGRPGPGTGQIGACAYWRMTSRYRSDKAGRPAFRRWVQVLLAGDGYGCNAWIARPAVPVEG